LAVERVTRVAAVFPGQGSHGIGMGGALRDHPVSAALFERADRILGYDLLAIVRDGPEEKLRETRYSQPAIFAVGYALAAVAVADGLNVVASAGHSFAEICSLTLAGALSFDEGLTLVRERGLAMHEAAQTAPGAMSAVLGLDEPARSVACNSQTSTHPRRSSSAATATPWHARANSRRPQARDAWWRSMSPVRGIRR
jgi:[acyl-carrier-protein] S-malonyltransferase